MFDAAFLVCLRCFFTLVAGAAEFVSVAVAGFFSSAAKQARGKAMRVRRRIKRAGFLKKFMFIRLRFSFVVTA